MEWTVYILRCRDGTLYTGVTKNLQKRIASHERGKGAKYTRGRGPFLLCLAVSKLTKSEALKLEYAIKKLPAQQKQELVQNGIKDMVGKLEELSK